MNAINDLRRAIARLDEKGLLVTRICVSYGFNDALRGAIVRATHHIAGVQTQKPTFDGIPVAVDERLLEEVGFYLDCTWTNRKPQEPPL